jgi:N utilization substance protein A
MAKRTKKTENTQEQDNREFFMALDQLEKERGIKKQYMLDKIAQALATAYKKDHEGTNEKNVSIIADEERNLVRIIIRREVVEVVDNSYTEISLEDARRSLPNVQLGDVVSSEIRPKNFGRIAAQTARQVIIQGIREAERNRVFDAFTEKTAELMTGVVSRIDERSGALYVKLAAGGESTEALLSATEQVKGEVYHEGDRIKVYVVDVRRSTRGSQVQVVISRTHFGLVRRLFEMEVPEIFDGVVEIRSISREAGSRTKMAVWSNDPAVDSIGACVGTRGQRVNAVVEELGGEKVDIIKYSDDPSEYVAAALAPADVVSVEVLDDDVKSCRVVVPDDQLSLAIGKEGQNARLAAKLTGYKIDIKSVTAAEQESQLGEDDLLLEEETAEESIPAETAAEESAPVEEVSPAEPEVEQE